MNEYFIKLQEAEIRAAQEGKIFNRLSDFRIRDKVIPVMVWDIIAMQAVIFESTTIGRQIWMDGLAA